MKKIKIGFSVFFLILSIASCSEKIRPTEVLFQENANDWFSEGDATWNFMNNELTAKIDSGAGFVMTEKSYSNFILELEFKPNSSINSGIFMRCKEKQLSNKECYEINIWDLHPNQDNRTGAVVNRAKPLKMVHTLDKWNTYKIKNDKDHLQVWVNDMMTIDMKDTDLKEGPIALQAAESGQISFRNVKITSLK